MKQKHKSLVIFVSLKIKNDFTGVYSSSLDHYISIRIFYFESISYSLVFCYNLCFIGIMDCFTDIGFVDVQRS